QRRQQASLSQRRKLNRQSKLKDKLKEATNSSGDLLTATLSDGSVVQVSDLVLPAPDYVRDVPLLHDRNRRGAFSDGSLVFYRSKNPSYDGDRTIAEWLIYVGKVISYIPSESQYSLQVYCPGDAGTRWLPLWNGSPKRGVQPTIRRSKCPPGAKPKVVKVLESDVLAKCDLTPSGSLGPNAREWLHAAGVAPSSSTAD
ncbi:hypothetical protein FOL47_004905, partial [Perkinsus chesapeaki]